MASGTINFTTNNSKLAGKIEWSSISNGSVANSSNITASLYVRRTDGYTTKGTWTGGIEVAGKSEEFSNASTTVGSDWVLMKTFTVNDAKHADNGTATTYISGYCNAPSGTSLENSGVWGNATVTLDTIPRYANFTTHYISSTGLNSINVNWNADSNCDAVQYSLNGGSWVTTSGTSYTISGLNPNTSYSIKTRIRRADSGLWTESGTITGTTKDIGKISTANNFNHGDNTVIGITNPSGSSLKLFMKIGNTQILSRTVSAGNNTISFSDIELDNIYKLYGSSNSLTATFILTTAEVYTNSKTTIITLTGNQKTAYTTGKKRAKVYVGINGSIKKAVVWVGNNGRKRCI